MTILRLAQELTQLTAVSTNGWKGRCPLCRAEASFFVDAANGLFHCFGCTAEGNLIILVMLSQQLRYGDAVEWLRLGEQ